MSKLDNLRNVLQSIRSCTQPCYGHTDPNSIDDCWNEVESLLNDLQEDVNKQIPQKARPYKKIPDISRCPVCKTDLCIEDGKTRIYCPDCGQALLI